MLPYGTGIGTEKDYLFQYNTNLEGNDLNRSRHLNVAYFGQVSHPSFTWISQYLKEDIECSVNDYIDKIENGQIKSDAEALFAPFFQ